MGGGGGEGNLLINFSYMLPFTFLGLWGVWDTDHDMFVCYIARGLTVKAVYFCLLMCLMFIVVAVATTTVPDADIVIGKLVKYTVIHSNIRIYIYIQIYIHL